MKEYNPKNTLKLNPEQQAIKDFRQAEYQRKYAIRSEDKVNLYRHVYTPCIHGEEAILEIED